MGTNPSLTHELTFLLRGHRELCLCHLPHLPKLCAGVLSSLCVPIVPMYDAHGVDGATWVLVTGNRQFLESADVRTAVTPWDYCGPLPTVWTDNFSNLFEVLAD